MKLPTEHILVEVKIREREQTGGLFDHPERYLYANFWMEPNGALFMVGAEGRYYADDQGCFDYYSGKAQIIGEISRDRFMEKSRIEAITANRCNTCKYWVKTKDNNSYRGDDIISPRDPESYEQEEGEEAIAAKWGHTVRFCGHPKLEFSQRPESNAMAVIDGSEYWAALLTGEDFGCILHIQEK